MEEKKKIDISNFILIICIIVIATMGYAISELALENKELEKHLQNNKKQVESTIKKINVNEVNWYNYIPITYYDLENESGNKTFKQKKYI